MSERDPELERLFRAARREEEPTDEDRRAVRHALAVRVAAAAAAGTVATLSTRAAAAGIAKTTMFGWFGTGLAAGAAVGAVVTAGAVYSAKSSAPEAPVAAPMSASAPRQEPSVPVPVAAVPAASAPVSESSARVPVASEAPVPTARIAASAAPSLEVETRALADVQRELRDGRPDSALRLLDAQTRSFANGALQEERAAARVLALCAAGRLWEARRARQRFLETYPQSPSADRVRASCPR